MAQTQDYSFIEKYARHGKEHPSSHQVFHAYHNRARAAMMEFARPVVQSLPYERAKRLVDLQKLADIQRARDARTLDAAAAEVPEEDRQELSLLEEVEEEGEGGSRISSPVPSYT